MRLGLPGCTTSSDVVDGGRVIANVAKGVRPRTLPARNQKSPLLGVAAVGAPLLRTKSNDAVDEADTIAMPAERQ